MRLLSGVVRILVAPVKGDIPRIMNTILITMMKAVGMGRLQNEGNLTRGARAPYPIQEK